MKTILTRLLAIFILAVSISSCSKNDDDNTVGSVVGKWTPIESTLSAPGFPTQTYPYDENTLGCDKNYYEFLANGSLKYVEYKKVNNVCTPTTDLGTWTQNGNTLTATDGTQTDTITIDSLTATQMVWKQTEVEAGVTYNVTITFARI